MGLAFIVTGAVSVFQECVLHPLQRESIEQTLTEHEAKSEQRLTKLRDGFQNQLTSMTDLLRGAGIRMLCPQRQGFSGFHTWLLEQAPQEIFFAGHSVLHRVQIDFRSRQFAPVEKALLRKLKENSRIRIMFLDPTWDYLDKLARAESEAPEGLRTNLAVTLAICQRLWQAIQNLELPGSIEIRTCSEFEQYAFHHIICAQRAEDQMLMGFYFAQSEGMKTPLFVVDNERIREEFRSHFNIVFGKGQQLMHYSQQGTTKGFNHAYYEACQKSLAEHLGHERLTEIQKAEQPIVSYSEPPVRSLEG